MANILKRVVGKVDNFIDPEVDRVLKSFVEETPEQFNARWNNLSDRTKDVMKVAIKEQIKVETKHQRLENLEKLSDYLETL